MTDATKADANELLIPALLSMDVYHRDVAGGMFKLLEAKNRIGDSYFSA
jgi:hypothetical protein